MTDPRTLPWTLPLEARPSIDSAGLLVEDASGVFLFRAEVEKKDAIDAIVAAVNGQGADHPVVVRPLQDCRCAGCLEGAMLHTDYEVGRWYDVAQELGNDVSRLDSRLASLVAGLRALSQKMHHWPDGSTLETDHLKIAQWRTALDTLLAQQDETT